MRPEQRLAVDILLEQPLAHHQAQILARPAPGFVGLLVDDVAQVVQTPRHGRTPGGQPVLPALPALPRPRGEAQYLGLHAAAFQRARHDVGADRETEEHTSELQSLMRISYAVFCLKKTTLNTTNNNSITTV